MRKGLIVILVLLILCGIPGCNSTPPKTAVQTITAFPAANTSTILGANTSFADVVAKDMPSVVFVQSETPQADGSIVVVSGSGVILDSNGYILTNKHVIDGAKTIDVILENRQTYIPTGVWEDTIFDLAVLKINAPNLTALPLADPNSLRVGDWAIALGHPLSVSPLDGGATVTAGIISNLGRSFWIGNLPYYDIIQTDAAINPGNSGGPLINANGEFIGLDSAASDQGQSIGFAINVATAGHIFQDLVKYGTDYHTYLGVSLGDVTQSANGVQTSASGAMITAVADNSPAGVAGLKVNDIITSFNGQAVTQTSDLIRELFRLDVNQTVSINVIRGQSNLTLVATLVKRPTDIVQSTNILQNL